MEELHSWNLSVVDYVMLGIVALFTLKGLIRGLSHELSGMIMLCTALAGSLFFYHPLAEWIMSVTRLSGTAAQVTSFAGSLLILWIALKLIGMLVALAIQLTFTPALERIGGGGAGLAKALMLIGVVLMTVRLSGHEYLQRQLLVDARLGALGNRHLPAVYAQLARIFPQLPRPAGEGDPEEELDENDPIMQPATAPEPHGI